MKNLKRILSLALASVMVMGMMVVGASAAAIPDEADISADFKNAVLTLNALGIMNGKEGGKIDPKATLTRAEMATMIATVLNRGTAPNFGVKNTPSFSDIDNHWGESYIEYVVSMKAMNGVGGGKFSPDVTLTATTAARTILNMMGYSIDDPSNWELLTEAQARQESLDLYAGLDKEITDPSHHNITREQFAQMLNNALKKPMEGDNTYTTTEQGVTGTTIQSQWQINLVAEPATGWVGDLASAEATAKTAAWKKLDARKFDSKADAKAEIAKVNTAAAETTNYTLDSILTTVDVKGNVTVTKAETLGHKYLSMDTITIDRVESVEEVRDGYRVNGTYTVAEDLSGLMGQKATAIVKKNAAGNITKTYGITAAGSVVYTGTVGEYAATYAAMASSNTKTAIGNAKIYDFNNFATNEGRTISGNIASVNKEYSLKLVKNSNTSYVAVVTPVVAVKVTNVTSKAIVTSPAVTGSSASLSTVNDDTLAVDAYEGIAKNDIVIATPADNTVDGLVKLVKAETVTGDVAGKRGDDLLIGGQWYKKAANLMSGSSVPALGAREQTLTMVNGYYVAVAGPAAAGSNKDLVVVTQIGNTVSGAYDSYVAVRVLDLATGETQDVKAESTSHGFVVGSLGYMTDTDEDGLNEFVAVSASEKAGYDGYETAGAVYGTTTTINSKRIADDAKVVVLYKDKTNASDSDKTDITTAPTATNLTASAVVDGKTLKGWKTNVGAATQTLTKNVNGIAYAQVVVVAIKADNLPGAAGTDKYGYIVGEAPYMITENRVNYLTYTVWDGEENVTVKDRNTTSRNVGDIIKFSDKGDGFIQSENAAITTQGAVMGYNAADGIISISGSTITSIVEGTDILFVDHATKTGVAGGEIVLATESEDHPGVYTYNVWYKANGTTNTNADLIVVEVNNDTDPTATTNVNDTRVTLTINKDLKSTSFEVTSFTYNGITTDVKGAADNIAQKVKVGETLTLNMKATAAGTKTITVSDGTNTINTEVEATYTANQEFTIRCTVQAGGTLAITEA